MTQPENVPSQATAAHALIRHHMRLGWWSMLAFVTLGIGLEALHAAKALVYLGVGNETRRLMWTLAHAHGIGLSLLQLGFAATLSALALPASPRLGRASELLTWGAVFVPLGFFLGGITTHGGDPGLGIVLVPLGALGIWVAVLQTAWTIHKHGARAPLEDKVSKGPEQG